MTTKHDDDYSGVDDEENDRQWRRLPCVGRCHDDRRCSRLYGWDAAMIHSCHVTNSQALDHTCTHTRTLPVSASGKLSINSDLFVIAALCVKKINARTRTALRRAHDCGQAQRNPMILWSSHLEAIMSIEPKVTMSPCPSLCLLSRPRNFHDSRLRVILLSQAVA